MQLSSSDLNTLYAEIGTGVVSRLYKLITQV